MWESALARAQLEDYDIGPPTDPKAPSRLDPQAAAAGAARREAANAAATRAVKAKGVPEAEPGKGKPSMPSGKGKGWQGLPKGPPPKKGGKAEPAPGKSGKGKAYGPHGIPEAAPGIVGAGHWGWVWLDNGKGKGEGKGLGKDEYKAAAEAGWQQIYEQAEAAALERLQAAASNLTTGKSPGAISDARSYFFIISVACIFLMFCSCCVLSC
jgi:hypothetical protein